MIDMCKKSSGVLLIAESPRYTFFAKNQIISISRTEKYHFFNNLVDAEQSLQTL